MSTAQPTILKPRAGSIAIRGLRVHNLKGIDLNLPLNSVIGVCGVSGSGKSSLVVDTLFAEGQRRYLECLTADARQLFEQHAKPDADHIGHVPPALHVTDQVDNRSELATVAEISEVAPLLRAIYAGVGEILCPQCRQVVREYTSPSISDWIAALPADTQCLIGLTSRREKKQSIADWIRELQKDGFVRAAVNGRVVRIENLAELLNSTPDRLELLVDRVRAGSTEPGRIRESLESALASGNGECWVMTPLLETREFSQQPRDGCCLDRDQWLRFRFTGRSECDTCGWGFPPLQSELFRPGKDSQRCRHCRTEEAPPGGVETCPICLGSQLGRIALSVVVHGRSLAELLQLKPSQLQEWLGSTPWTTHDRELLANHLQEIDRRLEQLLNMGLGHLPLVRSALSLSSGETRRASMVAALASNLVQTLYVFDEPTSSLHSADVSFVMEAMGRLKRRGNSVVFADHSLSLLQASDHLLELGPGAGEEGGNIIFWGPPEEITQQDESVTGDWIACRRGGSLQGSRRDSATKKIKLQRASGNNLREVSAEFPLERMTVVSGVSGSGKTSLVSGTLFPAVCRHLEREGPRPLPYQRITGVAIQAVEWVDGSRLPKSIRSNPVTYIKAYDEIRKLYAETADAKTAGLTARHFSFNTQAGRCENCNGHGTIAIDMQMLPNLELQCPDCLGRRFRPEILQAHYRGANIAEALAMTAREAFTFFRGAAKLQGQLKHLIDAGLDYVRLGQSLQTLSNGETQRLKLAGLLARPRTGRTLFIFDEPTTGLHEQDILRMIDCFDALLAVGHTIVAADHSLRLIRSADWVIDLGPGAGELGGEILAQGPPKEIMACSESKTGAYLRKLEEMH